MVKEVVIALHNKDISWINQLNSDIKVTIYRKGNITSHPDEIKIENNVGRDVHTFFYHLVNRYNTLSDYTFFSQDYPFDHIENYVDIINGTPNLWNTLATQHSEEYWGYHFNTIGTAWDLFPLSTFGGVGLISKPNGSPHDRGLNITEVWNSLFSSPPPSSYEFTPGGHFCVSKSQICLRSLEFYKKVLTLLETKAKSPWEIERLEPYIFSSQFKSL